MQSYYKQLEPYVFNYLESFQTDFTKHDWENLYNYKGDFIYAIRKSGTDLFLTTPLKKAINNLIKLNFTDYFNKQGYYTLLYENYYGYELFYATTAILKRSTNKIYLFGSGGKINQVSKPYMNKLIEQEVNKPIQFLKSIINTKTEVRNHVIHLMNQI